MPTSSHFKEAELVCRDGCGLNNIKLELLSKLEQLRVRMGHPIIINSASRCTAYNSEVGGAPNSAHLTGDAVDIRCVTDQDRFNLLRQLIELGFCRIGIDSRYIHADLSDILPQAVIWVYPPR